MVISTPSATLISEDDDSGRVVRRLPKILKPRHVLSTVAEYGPVDNPAVLLWARFIVEEGLRELGDELREEPLWKLPKDERLRTMFQGMLLRTTRLNANELWFVTINLASNEEPDAAIENLFRRLRVQPPLWVGVYVPGSRRIQRHVHAVISVPIDFEVIKHLARFETYRNRRRLLKGGDGRSAFIRDVDDVAGLYRYLAGNDNLGIAGAKVLASKAARAAAH